MTHNVSFMNKGEMLDAIKEYLNMKKNTELASFLGISSQAVSNWYSRNTFDAELIYTKCVNLSAEWLLTGKGSMKKTIIEDKPILSNVPSIGVPYYDVDFIGGFELVINDQTIVPTHNIVFEPFKEADFWCNATGSSMAEKINHGDVIALKKVDKLEDILFGEIYAVVLESRRTIKIIRKAKDPTKLRFIPANTIDYDEQEFPISQIRKIYAVLGSIRKFF